MSSFTIEWTDICKHLKNKEIAIEFATVPDGDDKQYLAFVVNRYSSAPKVYSLFKERDLLGIPAEAYYSGRQLYDLVWAPLSDELKDATTIYFSPAGELNSIAIEYITDLKAFRLSSTRELVRTRKRGQIRTAALFGGIDYNAGPEALAKQAKTINAEVSRRKNHSGIARGGRGAIMGAEDLPGTIEEVDAITVTMQNKHKSVKCYKAENATEEAVKQYSGSSPDVLHFATHGFFWDSTNAEDLPPFAVNSTEKAMEEDRVMSFTGLFDIPLPDSLEDGILTAREISTIDLQDTELVVLAACQSGLGEIKGDGVFGLQRGFKKAGVDTIVMSLWNVDDDATCLMMTSFYDALCSGNVSPRDALDHAREIVRSKYPDPKYWASFIVLDSN